MSLGATASAPACAWETAVRASSSSVASLSTTPSARSTPQWPWLGYSHRHRAGITSRSGGGALIAGGGRGVRAIERPRGELDAALVVPRAGALRVLRRWQPEQQPRGDPERGRLARLA